MIGSGKPPRGLLLILSGPSGVGKDTVIEAWRERDPLVQRVVAFTTRQPRPGEIDGVDYRFVSQEEFAERVAAGTFLEWKEVHGQYYGTPAQEVDELLAAGRIAILKIDVQGALAVMEVRPDAVAVFIMPPSLHDLEARLRDRGSEDAETIALRMRNARKEMEQAPKYHFRVVNDHVGRCVDELEAIVAGYRDGVQTAGSEPIQ